MAEYPEAVTFDFHNTIARCDQWFRLEVHDLAPAFLNWHANQNGRSALPVSPEQARVVYRRIRRDVMLHGFEKDAVTCMNLVTAELGYQLDIDHISTGVDELMRGTLNDSQPIEGVVHAIRTLSDSGVRLAVISSAAYHPFLEWSLEKFGVLDRFDVIVTSASSGYYKSRTEIYSRTVEALGTSPARTVHVGDSVTYDVNTASRIGMGTVLFDPERREQPANGAGAVVTSLLDLPSAVTRVYQEKHG